MARRCCRHAVFAELRGTWDVEAVFQVFSVSANENRAGVLGHGELPEAEELGGVEWPSSVDNEVHKVASDKVPIESTDPRTRVGEKTGYYSNLLQV